MPAGAIPFPFGDCRVCNDHATGVHYGVATCEGCKGFFKRSLPKAFKYRCFHADQCSMNPLERNRCKSCRFRRCIDVGMSVEGVKMGRIPKVDKERALEEFRLKAPTSVASTGSSPPSKRHASSTSFTKGPKPQKVATITALESIQYSTHPTTAIAGSGNWPAETGQKPHMASLNFPQVSIAATPSDSCSVYSAGSDARDYQQRQVDVGHAGNFSREDSYLSENISLYNGALGQHLRVAQQYSDDADGGIWFQAVERSQKPPGGFQSDYHSTGFSLDSNSNGRQYDYSRRPAQSSVHGSTGSSYLPDNDGSEESPEGSSSLSPSEDSSYRTSTCGGIRAPAYPEQFGARLHIDAVRGENGPVSGQDWLYRAGSPTSMHSPETRSNLCRSDSSSSMSLSAWREMSPFYAPVIKELLSQVIETGHGKELQHTLVKQFLASSASTTFSNSPTSAITTTNIESNAKLCRSGSYSASSSLTSSLLTSSNSFGCDMRTLILVKQEDIPENNSLLATTGNSERQNPNVHFNSSRVADINDTLRRFVPRNPDSDDMHRDNNDENGLDNDPRVYPLKTVCLDDHVSDFNGTTYKFSHHADSLNMHCNDTHASTHLFKATHNDQVCDSSISTSTLDEHRHQNHSAVGLRASEWKKYDGQDQSQHALAQSSDDPAIEEMITSFKVEDVNVKDNDCDSEVNEDGFILPPNHVKQIIDSERFNIPSDLMPRLEFLDEDMCATNPLMCQNAPATGSDADNLHRTKLIGRVRTCLEIVANRLMDIIEIEKQITLDEQAGIRPIHPLNVPTTENVTQNDIRQFWNEMMNIVPRNNSIIIGISSNIPGFKQLDLTDQVVLVEGAYCVLWMIMYSPLVWGGDGYMRLNNEARYSRVWMSMFFPEKLVTSIFSFIEELNACQLTPAELIILCALQLTDADGKKLSNQRKVQLLHDYYLDLLAYEIERTHSTNHSKVLFKIFQLLPLLVPMNQEQRNLISTYSVNTPPDQDLLENVNTVEQKE